MCGITGVYAYNMVGRMHFMQLENATRALQSRGPDYHDSYHDNKVALGHRRLSIIDTSEQGNQPMVDGSGRYIIIYNGEIFNFQELKHKLEGKGYTFRSGTDTEVLLCLYNEYGKECLNMLNGFFAFAIYDKEAASLFVARDRFGIKPLYYSQDDNSFVFASELKSLTTYGLQKELDYVALTQYLQMNYISAPRTIFKNINKLQPGHYVHVSPEKIEKEQWYKATTKEQNKGKSYEELKKELHKLLDESVRMRLVSDVPLGTFLSGGIDSSVITMLAAKHKPDLHSFSIGFKDNKFFDETAYATLVSKKAGTEHTVFEIGNKDLLDTIEDILDYTDEPFADSSAIAVNILCRETRKYATVALSGDGADELFGGYNKHEALLRIAKGGSLVDIARMGKPLWYLLPKSRNNFLTNKFRQLYRLAEGASLEPNERYWRWASYANEREALKLLNPESRQRVDQESYQQFKGSFTCFIKNDLNSQLLGDVNMVLPDDMLVKVDRMSMKNSLEVRVPFLDYRVAEFSFSLAEQYKIHGGVRKKIIQDTFREILPEELYNRPKQGFEVPLLSWLKGDLREKIESLLDERFVREQGIFDYTEIKRLTTRLGSINPGDSHARIWGLIVFQHWYKRYM